MPVTKRSLLGAAISTVPAAETNAPPQIRQHRNSLRTAVSAGPASETIATLIVDGGNSVADAAAGVQAPAPYLTEAEFCRRYHVRPRTAQRWRVTGDGPPWVRAGKRRIIYSLAGCEEWAAARTFRSRADELSRKVGGAP